MARKLTRKQIAKKIVVKRTSGGQIKEVINPFGTKSPVLVVERFKGFTAVSPKTGRKIPGIKVGRTDAAVVKRLLLQGRKKITVRD